MPEPDVDPKDIEEYILELLEENGLSYYQIILLVQRKFPGIDGVRAVYHPLNNLVRARKLRTEIFYYAQHPSA